MDTTVCNGHTVNIYCGVINDPFGLKPDWRIIQRHSNGSIISDMYINGISINNNHVDGLVWIPDNNTENNRLLVGPVDESYNQSSYQCLFSICGGTLSSNGTLTVVGEILFIYVYIYIYIYIFICMYIP